MQRSALAYSWVIKPPPPLKKSEWPYLASKDRWVTFEKPMLISRVTDIVGLWLAAVVLVVTVVAMVANFLVGARQTDQVTYGSVCPSPQLQRTLGLRNRATQGCMWEGGNSISTPILGTSGTSRWTQGQRTGLGAPGSECGKLRSGHPNLLDFALPAVHPPQCCLPRNLSPKREQWRSWAASASGTLSRGTSWGVEPPTMSLSPSGREPLCRVGTKTPWWGPVLPTYSQHLVWSLLPTQKLAT